MVEKASRVFAHRRTSKTPIEFFKIELRNLGRKNGALR